MRTTVIAQQHFPVVNVGLSKTLFTEEQLHKGRSLSTVQCCRN